jgi:hypothetical protein
MSVEEWIEVFSGLVTQFSNLNATLAANNADMKASVDGLTASITNMTATINNLGTMALMLSFLFLLIFLAYWRREALLHFLSGAISIIFSFLWLQSRDIQYMKIIGIAALGLGVVTLFIPVLDWMRSRRR